jgi:hypothetical protein
MDPDPTPELKLFGLGGYGSKVILNRIRSHGTVPYVSNILYIIYRTRTYVLEYRTIQVFLGVDTFILGSEYDSLICSTYTVVGTPFRHCAIIKSSKNERALWKKNLWMTALYFSAKNGAILKNRTVFLDTDL